MVAEQALEGISFLVVGEAVCLEQRQTAALEATVLGRKARHVDAIR
jgi:hypothetical protein